MTTSGCFMAPIAFLAPAASGYSTASIMQTTATSGVNYLVKRSTGKTIPEHAFDSLSKDILQQAYFPKEVSVKEIK